MLCFSFLGWKELIDFTVWIFDNMFMNSLRVGGRNCAVRCDGCRLMIAIQLKYSITVDIYTDIGT